MQWAQTAFAEHLFAKNNRLWQCFHHSQLPQANHREERARVLSQEVPHSDNSTETVMRPSPLAVVPPVAPLSLQVSEYIPYLDAGEASPTTIMSPNSPRTPYSKAATPKPPKIEPPSLRLLVSATSQSGWTMTKRAVLTDLQPEHSSSADARLTALSWLKMCESALDDELGPESPGTPFDAKYWELPHPQAERPRRSWWSKLKTVRVMRRPQPLEQQQHATNRTMSWSSRSKSEPVVVASRPVLSRSSTIMTSHLERRGRFTRKLRHGSPPAMMRTAKSSYNAEPI